MSSKSGKSNNFDPQSDIGIRREQIAEWQSALNL
jgi:hypothetical protein